jgi:hypothetical protein
MAPKSMAPKALDFSGSSVIKKELQTFVCYVAYELMVSKDTMNTMAQYAFMEKQYLGDGSQDLALCEQALRGMGIFEGLYDSSVSTVTATVASPDSAVTLTLKLELHCESERSE